MAPAEIEEVFFVPNPYAFGYNVLPRDYIKIFLKLRGKPFPEYSDEFSGIKSSPNPAEQHVSAEAQGWISRAVSLVGAPRGVYYRTNHMLSYRSGPPHRIYDAVSASLTSGFIPITHKEVGGAIRLTANGQFRDVLDAIEGLDLTARVFEPLKEEDIQFIARDCEEYLLKPAHLSKFKCTPRTTQGHMPSCCQIG